MEQNDECPCCHSVNITYLGWSRFSQAIDPIVGLGLCHHCGYTWLHRLSGKVEDRHERKVDETK